MTKDNYSNLDNKNKEKLAHQHKILKIYTKERIKIPSIDKSKRPISFTYVRYADDFIILSNAKKPLAETLKKEIGNWLKVNLMLELSEEKTKITDITINHAHFLGFILYTYTSTKLSKNEDGTLKKTGGYNIKVGIDMDRILKRYLLKSKFCNKDYKPIGIRPYSVLPIREIINKFNAIIQGTANYYFPVIDIVTSFSRIYYILQYSCYGTIATKYKTSIYKLFKKFGKFPQFKIELDMKFKGKSPNKIEPET